VWEKICIYLRTVGLRTSWMNSQLNSSAALPQGKSTWYPLDRKLDGPYYQNPCLSKRAVCSGCNACPANRRPLLHRSVNSVEVSDWHFEFHVYRSCPHTPLNVTWTVASSSQWLVQLSGGPRSEHYSLNHMSKGWFTGTKELNPLSHKL
jgi:hypothetical protein